jgi:chemotaxis response regulator CheB
LDGKKRTFRIMPPKSTSEKNPVKTRILVLEEHPLLRQGITDYLDSQPDLIVCGGADNIRDARNKIAEHKPHLLVTAPINVDGSSVW